MCRRFNARSPVVITSAVVACAEKRGIASNGLTQGNAFVLSVRSLGGFGAARKSACHLAVF